MREGRGSTSRRGDDSKVISPRVTSAHERLFYREANEAVRADFAALGFALRHIDDKETGIAREERQRESEREAGLVLSHSSPSQINPLFTTEIYESYSAPPPVPYPRRS